MNTDNLNPVDLTDTEARLIAFRELFVSHLMARLVDGDLWKLLLFGRIGAQSGVSARIMTVTGASGAGKTAILRRFADRHPPIAAEDRELRPVLYVTVEAGSSRKALAGRILSALGIDVTGRETEVELRRRAIHFLKELQVKVLILDEAQGFFQRGGAKDTYEATDWIKSLANEAVCAIVLSGDDDVWKAYRENPQLERRSMANHRLLPFRWNGGKDLGLYMAVLEKFADAMPVRDEVGIAKPKTAAAILATTRGFMGRTADFLVDCAMHALVENGGCLKMETLVEVAAKRANPLDAIWRNPFLLNPSQVVRYLNDLEASSVTPAPEPNPTMAPKGTRQRRAA